MQERTEAQERAEDFAKGLNELREKYQCDVAATPVFNLNKEGAFEIRLGMGIVDIKNTSNEQFVVSSDEENTPSE